MVKNFKKNAAKVIALIVSVLMVLTILPISALVFAATTNHPGSVTITVTDENGDAVIGAQVTYSVHLVNADTDIIDVTDDAVDTEGVVEVISKDDFDAYIAADPTETFILNASAVADGFKSVLPSSVISDQPITSGLEDYSIILSEEIATDTVISDVAENLNYDKTEKTLLNVSAKAGDIISISVNDSYEAAEGDNKYQNYHVNADVTIPVKRTNAGDYAIKITIQRAKCADFEYSNTINIGKDANPQPITLALDETTPYIYNISESITCQSTGYTEKENDDDNVDISYSIVEDKTDKIGDELIATIVNGDIIKYNHPGQITVKATIAERPNYNQNSDEKTITVKYADFTDEVSVTSKGNYYIDASNTLWADSEGVELSCDGWTILDENEWKERLPVNNGTYRGEKAYSIKLKENSTGNITNDIKVRDFAIDTTTPGLQSTDKEKSQYGVEFKTVNGDIFSRTFHALTFGLFFKENIKVTVNAVDAESGVKTIELFLKGSDSDEWNEIISDQENGNVFTIPLGFKGTVKVIITDKVNYSSEMQITTANSNMEDGESGYVMLENNAPLVSDLTVVTPDEVTVYNDIYSGDVKVKFDAQDTESGLYQVKLSLFDGDINKYVSDYLAENENATVSDALAAIEDTKLVSIPVNVDEETNKTDTPIQYDSKDTYEHSYSTTTEQTDKVKPLEDGSYNYVALVFDNAGNVTGKYLRIEKDLTAPEISGFNFEPDDYLEGTKSGDLFEATNKAVELTDYGFYFKEDVTVTVYATDVNDNEKSDAISGVSSITWRTEDISGEASDWETYDVTIDENVRYITFTIKKDFKGQIYAYATDNVGNTYGEDGCVHPDGSVFETLNKHKTTSSIVIDAPETAFTQNNVLADFDGSEIEGLEPDSDVQQSGAVGTDNVPLYSKMSRGYNGTDGFNFDITVIDSYSGIRSVKYAFIKNNEDSSFVETKINNAGVFEDNVNNGWEINEETKDRNLVTEIKNTITAPDSIEDNDITLLVILIDRAGNTSYDFYTFGIDETNPDININYNPETGDDSYQQKDANEKDYYNAECTVTVTIKDRNFRKENVKLTTAGTVGAFPISETELQNRLEKGKNGDVYTATIEFSKDGDYKFNIECTDNADNSNNKSSKFFTIDNINPVVKIAYDNNDAKNSNYYKADRTATITVKEHNFDSSRVEITDASASETTFPSLSGWTSAGQDTYMAAIEFTADSLYKFDVVVTDKAGNVDTDDNKQEFTVDTTNPVLRISGIGDKSANSGKGNIGFTVTATDTNFDVFLPVITAVRYSQGSFDTLKINPGTISAITNGASYTVANIDTDGIYRITCTVVDKAGNAFSEVIIQDANGRSHTEQRSGDDVLLTFSVNRNGSVFYVDGYTEKLIKNYYTKNVTESVRINEVNADTIVKKTVTVNGKALTEGKDYNVSLDKSEGTWYRYTYNINESVFSNEGEYNIVIASQDRANNKAFSDIKNVTAKFVVDRTAPIVTIAGLQADGRYRTDKQVVTVIPSDDGGLLKSLIIRTVDKDGKAIKELVNLEGDDLLEAVEAGSITFELGEGLYQNVQIICEDVAGNIIGDSSSGEIYENVSVSTNAFLIFWANKVARYLAIAGVLVVLVGVVALVILKKKRKA